MKIEILEIDMLICWQRAAGGGEGGVSMQFSSAELPQWSEQSRVKRAEKNSKVASIRREVI